MRYKLSEAWNIEKRRRKLAVMKTRGFWIVNMVWFVAGFGFSQLLPARDPEVDYLSYALHEILLAAIVLPIYWCELLNFSAFLNQKLDSYKSRKHGKRPQNHES